MLALLLLALSQPAGPDAVGPHPIATASNVSVMAGGRAITADVMAPSDRIGAPFPVVILGHGFARTRAQVAGHAAHLASWGMIVVTPDFPSRFMPDHALNGRIMRDLLAWARGGPAPIGAIADPRRGAYVGHSAGGLAAFLAAAADPSVTALVGLDPVDDAGSGAAAGASIGASTLVLGAEPNRCNANASADAMYAGLSSAPRWFLRVRGATHCDAEDPTNGLCTATCGGEDAARRALFRRYLTAHLAHVFDCSAAGWVPGGAELTADLAGGGVQQLATQGAIGCAPTTADAGVAAPDAQGAPDAVAAPDADGPIDASATDATAADGPSDASAPATDATAADDADARAGEPIDASDAGSIARGATAIGPAPSTDDGCGCASARSHPATAAPLLLLLAGAIALRSRR